VHALLSGYVELSQPATTRDLRRLVEISTEVNTTKLLEDLLSSYTEKVVERRLSLLSLVENHAELQLSFVEFLYMLPSMRIRQYSISSSPLAGPSHVSLTISVLRGPDVSGRDEAFLGVASNFLSQLKAGDKVSLSVRSSPAAFHLPADPAVPLVLFAAGSGIAPMRGFIQERAIMKASGRQVGSVVLFFGCRNPGEDYLYGETELKEWVDQGVVDVRPAFSRATEASKGCKYVQE
jgi:cytochrome P450 / NADPH-cytochrome P450 reductase